MISSTIAKVNGRNKVIDFRDNLMPATLEDYANLHGVGGKNHAANSTIRCTICDYSKGKGDESVTVGANIAIDAIYKVYLAAKKQIIQPTQDNRQTITADGLTALNKVYAGLKNVYTSVNQGKTIDVKIISQLGNLTATGLKSIEKTDCGNFAHQQEKVDIYRKKTDGSAPVSKLVITRQGIRSDGQVSRYPWYIKITNGTAPVIFQESGATTYDAKKLSIKGEAFINVSDADMFRMMQRIVSYIRVWENTVCIPLVQRGLQQREQERLAAINNKN